MCGGEREAAHLKPGMLQKLHLWSHPAYRVQIAVGNEADGWLSEMEEQQLCAFGRRLIGICFCRFGKPPFTHSAEHSLPTLPLQASSSTHRTLGHAQVGIVLGRQPVAVPLWSEWHGRVAHLNASVGKGRRAEKRGRCTRPKSWQLDHAH